MSLTRDQKYCRHLFISEQFTYYARVQKCKVKYLEIFSKEHPLRHTHKDGKRQIKTREGKKTVRNAYNPLRG